MKQGKSVVVAGATGMVGGHVLRLALESPEVSLVTVVGRTSPGITHPKLREVLHADFDDCSPISEALTGHDVALYCIGAYTGAVSDDEFRKITVDFTVGFARTLHAHSPAAAFCFLSGSGADQCGKSRVAFARYKGEAERALLAQGFARVHLFRPGYIYPVVPRREPNLGYRVTRALYPALSRLFPGVVIPSVDLARAMLLAGLQGTGAHADPVLENSDIRALLEPGQRDGQ